MKTIATVHNQSGAVVGVLSGPDFVGQQIIVDQEITVGGRVWRFDFDVFYGPLWLRKDGAPRKCQNPNKSVWDAFEVWVKKNVKS